MATSITLSQQVSSDTKKTRSITNINPDANNQQLVNLATALNGLTTNTLKAVNRIDKTEIDPNKTYPTFTIVYDTPVQGVTYSDDGFTVTVDSANYAEGSAIMQIKVDDYTFDLPADYGAVITKYYNGSVPIFDPSANDGTQWQIGYYKYTSTVQKGTSTITFPEGTVTDGTHTHTIPAFTVTVNIV